MCDHIQEPMCFCRTRKRNAFQSSIFSVTEKYLLCSITKPIEGNLCTLKKTSSSFKIVMRDITTLHADVIAQKSARFGMIQTLPALSWGLPTIRSCVETLFSILQLTDHFQAGNFRGHSSIILCFSAEPFKYSWVRCKTGHTLLHLLSSIICCALWVC